MDSVQEMKGASIVVDTCAAIEPDEDVLVVTDWQVSDVAERVAAAANERDANVTMAMMEPREYDGNEPEDTVAAAMMEADVIITPVHRSITHSSATAEAKENGARVISMVKFTDEQLVRGGLYADYEGMRPHCEEMARKFTEASEARVTSPQGTDVTVDLEGRDGNAHPGIADEPGEFTALVHIESNIAPVEGGTDGTVVFDGAIPNLDIGVLEEPVRMEIEDGAVISVEGGKEAKTIERVWAEHDDPAVYNIAQLAVGMNPECPEFNGWFSNDHGRYGNVHFGIGTSSNLGGTTRAPVHFDAMMAEPTLELDGEVVVEDGDFTFF
ncbi:aminopeptidase [Halorubrum sp. DTA98]|uniref:aminopeptidase n=1 Tax=Halorubrum sp. DTA98 TaxID=3402163 RepID=UPI003AAB65AC